MINFMKKFYVVILLSCLLVACSKAKQDPNDDPAFAPVINPHPQYFMTVKGVIEPETKINLKIQAIYISNNKSCEYDASGGLEGAMVPRQRNIIFSVSPTKPDGSYSIRIPLDYFQPGKCTWAIDTIQFFSNSIPAAPRTLAIFNNNLQNLKSVAYIPSNTIICDQSLNCIFTKYGNFTRFLVANQNYEYEINYLVRK